MPFRPLHGLMGCYRVAGLARNLKVLFYSASAAWMVNFAFVWAVLAQNAPETGVRSVEIEKPVLAGVVCLAAKE